MMSTELAQRFLDSFRLHDVMHPEELEVDQEPALGAAEPLEAAGHILRAQAASRIESDMELIFNAPGPGRDVLELKENGGLLLALFIVARLLGGDVELRSGQVVIGDHQNDIEQVNIEVGAQRSDFVVEFLLRHEQLGPHPNWHAGADETVPTSLTVTKELALIREDYGGGEPCLSDHKTRRGGLASLGMLVMSYRTEEAGRDPFGLAGRALNDLKRATNDPFVQ